MSEVKKIATRASYGAALVELGKKHENLVVLDADLAAATQTGVFKKEFPERHIDCGIAEVMIAGGMIFNIDFHSADMIAVIMGFIVLYSGVVAVLTDN